MVDKNLRSMERLTRKAVGLGARWVMFHEGTLTDYTSRLDELAEPVPGGGSTRRMMDLAGELNCFISFGLSERDGDRFYIAQAFVGPGGFVHSYRKTWLWRSERDEGYRNEWARYDPGPGPEAFEFDGLKAVCFICADGEAPRCIDRAEAIRPEIVFFPNNRGSLPGFRVFGERAKRLGAPMLVTNRVGKSWVYDCRGGCVVYSSTGRVLARANRDGEEEILIHKLRIKSR
jgi:predicted amidohydrolase